ncbi:MAG: methionyl-tRNA formyltransferase [Alphaproteobacteria bacterium]|nr:methionyl-tRNA formyltransferase [Alphaproteobacteria bacterium]
MRIVVNGQQAFGKAVLEKLLERGEDVIAVYGTEDSNGRVDPTVEYARERGLPVYQPATFKTEEATEGLRAMKPDLGVMAYVTKLVPPSFLNVPTKGTIQYHPSLLPRHRGPSSINWPIIQGETRTGLSIFWPDDGLDTGPVLLQKEVEIGPDDTLGSIYFNHLFPMGVEAMLEAVDLVRDGKAPRIEQDEEKATYESWCKAEDVEIDWSRPAGDVYNLIRGANPQPGAWTTCNGRKLQIFDARRDGGSGGPTGSIVATGEDGFTVAAGRGAIFVQRVRPEGGVKIAAREYAAERGLKPGDALGG